MANPFALVISVGCCYFFLFLSLCTAPRSPYLHLTQTALPTVRWFNLGDDSNHPMVRTNRTNRSMPLSRQRRQWDPGMPMVWLPVQAPSPRGRWDPGVRSTACRVNTSRRGSADDVMMARCFVLTLMPVTVTVMMQSFALRLRRQWDPGVANVGVVTMVRINRSM